MRKPIIAGNWKMNKTRDEALQFIYSAIPKLPNKSEIETVICAPAIFLRCLVKRQGENLRIGAQNMHYQESGAFTGEISPISIKDIGVKYVIIGHSERREYYNETDETVNQKVLSAISHKIIPIVCVGETLEHRENGKTNKIIDRQIKKAFEGVQNHNANDIVIAYEPLWAIGTGKTATPEMANETCKHIRKTIESLYGKKTAESIRIQYGGSVKPSNIKELMQQEHIDGALVGGSSLDVESFLKLLDF